MPKTVKAGTSDLPLVDSNRNQFEIKTTTIFDVDPRMSSSSAHNDAYCRVHAPQQLFPPRQTVIVK